MNTINYEEMSLVELVKIVDDKFYEAKRKKMSRFDIWWGKWSRKFNLSLRGRIEGKKEDADTTEGLKYIFIYWTTISNILEMYSSFGSFLHAGKRKKLVAEAKKIKKIIIDECFGKLSKISYEDLAKTFSMGK